MEYRKKHVFSTALAGMTMSKKGLLVAGAAEMQANTSAPFRASPLGTSGKKVS